MQKRIQKETGNNCLKRIIVAFLAVIMMTTMLHPQMVQAATGITIESKDNKVLTYKAGEKKTWTFTVTNHSGNPMNNVTVTPDLGDAMMYGHSKQRCRVTSRTLEPWKTENQKMWRLILLREKMFRLHAIL